MNCILPTSVIAELNWLKAEAKPDMVRQVDFALLLAKKCEKVEVVIKEGDTVDDSIVELAKSLNLPVATNDTVLRRSLRDQRIPIIYLRQKTHLAMTLR